MEACTLQHIPARLHSENKPNLPQFELGERIFRRCKTEHLDHPFDGISLYDLSTNREGSRQNPLCELTDVLYNLNPDNGKGNLLNESVIPLEIKELAESGTYEKTVSQDGQDGEQNPITYTCFIKLLHDNLPCNYCHCIFRITFEGTVVTSQNWTTTLGRKGNTVTKMRTKCKLEFEEMIIKGEIWINN